MTKDDIQPSFYRELLRAELARRARRNPRYSMRAFAKSLAVDAAVLSRVLGGKRALSARSAGRIAEKLELGVAGRRRFLASVARDQATRRIAVTEPKGQAGEPAVVHALEADLFAVVADWHHYAILELTYTDGWDGNARTVATRLGITHDNASAAIERLVRVGLLIEQDGKLVKAQRALHAATPQLTSRALRRHQKQLLAKALNAVDGVAAERRAVTTLVLPVNPQHLTLARRLLEEFSWQLCRHLAHGHMTEVYALSACLFPLEKQNLK